MSNPFSTLFGGIGEGIGAFRYAQSKPFADELKQQQAQILRTIAELDKSSAELAQRFRERDAQLQNDYTTKMKVLDAQLAGDASSRRAQSTISVNRAGSEDRISEGNAGTANQGYLFGKQADAVNSIGRSATGNTLLLKGEDHKNTMALNQQRFESVRGLLGAAVQGDLNTMGPILGNNPDNPVLDRFLAYQRGENDAERQWISGLVSPQFRPGRELARTGLDLARTGLGALIVNSIG